MKTHSIHNPLRQLSLALIMAITCLYQGQAFAQFTEASWTTHTSMPGARGQAATAVDANGRIYVIGGYENNGEVNTNYRFTPGTPGTWETLAPLPTIARGASAVYAGGKVYVFGGYSPSGVVLRVQAYDVTAGTWTDTALAGLSWENEATISSDGRIFITGGETTDQTLNEFTPPATLTPRASMSIGHKEHGAAFIGTNLYVFGGAAINSYIGIAGVESYDVGANTWSAAATDLPAARCQFAYAASSSFVFVMGGGSSNGTNYSSPILNTTLSYDPLTNAWATGPNLPAPSREGTAAIVGTRLYVFGGGSTFAASSAVYSIGVTNVPVAPAPTVTAILPTSGTTAGSTSVTITGTDFTGASAVTIGGVAATIGTITATTITATTGAHAAGLVDVAVTTPGGTGTGTNLYTYVAPVPEIAVFNGASTAPANERTDNVGTFGFGSVNTGSSSAAQTFTIQNTGTSNLTLGTVTLTGADLGQFSVTQPLSTPLAPNATTTFTATFSPTSAGLKNAVVNIASNDSDENPFEINVGGTGTALTTVFLVDHSNSSASAPTLGGTWNTISPNIPLTTPYPLLTSTGNSSGVTITYGGVFGSFGTQTAWARGNQDWVDAASTSDIFGSNTGATTSITFSGLVSGAAYKIDHLAARAGAGSNRSADYTINGQFADTTPNGDNFEANIDGYVNGSVLTWNSVTAVGGQITLTVTPINSSNFGYYVATRLTALGATQPEIAVFNGNSTAPVDERTDNVGTFGFGSVNTGSSSAAQTFTIKNTGTGSLTLGTVTLTGADLGQFSVTQPLSSSLAANATTTFTATFSPTSAGAKNAVVNIASNDSDENPFEIKVGGTGVSPSVIIDFQTLEIANGGSNDHGFHYEEDGYAFDNLATAHAFANWGTLASQYSGSTALFNNTIDGVTRLTQIGGGTFTLTSIKLAELVGPSVATVTFTGTRADTTTVTQAFTLDGIAFGAQTFTFPGGFTNLVKVEWAQVSPFHQFDDIVVSSASTGPLVFTGVPIVIQGGNYQAGGNDLPTREMNFTPTPGQSYPYIEVTGAANDIIGFFNDLPDGGVVAMNFNGVIYYFQVNYNGGVDGNDLIFTNLLNPGPANWKWTAGPDSRNAVAIFGAEDVGADANNPGARQGAMNWRAPNGSLWMFGGYGYASALTARPNYLNDLWEYNRTTGQWIWHSGAQVHNQFGTYGSITVSAAANTPGSRHTGTTWTDSSGDLWLFGGLGYGASGGRGRLNDLWRFSISTGQWTWMKGSNATGAAGVYSGGAATLTPGARQGATGWAAPGGNLYLFGGTTDGGTTFHNDLWLYATTGTGNWTLVKGDGTTNLNGTYGTQGTGAAANTPGARRDATGWVAKDGTLWLFGGRGLAETGATLGDMSDLWSFNTTTSNWTHVSGPKTQGAAGTYTALGSPGTPAARSAGSGWVTVDGDFWLVGGFKNSKDCYSDVWIYDIGSNTWTWKLGSSSLNVSGTYGTLGVAAPGNQPGARYTPSTWVTLNGAIWVFGGGGFDGRGSGGRVSDLWRYGIATPAGAPPEPSAAPFPDSLIVNDAPDASDAAAGTMAYVPVTGQLSGSDADGDNILFLSSSPTTLSQGTLTLNPDGTWSYTPAPGFVGQSTFQFRAADAYGGSSPVRTLVITVVTNPADSDNDGIADAYEQTYLGGTGADALGDADLDGQNNYFEYLAGTSPVDAAQSLSTAPSIAAGASDKGGSFKLDLNHVRPGVNYHLETSTDLDVWNRIGTFTFSVSGSATIEDPTPPSGQPQFYRVSLESPTLLP